MCHSSTNTRYSSIRHAALSHACSIKVILPTGDHTSSEEGGLCRAEGRACTGRFSRQPTTNGDDDGLRHGDRPNNFPAKDNFQDDNIQIHSERTELFPELVGVLLSFGGASSDDVMNHE